MELNEGAQQQTFEPVNGAISVMRSADGGDLVVAQINSEWTRSAGAGRESQPASDAEKALFGNGKATSTMKTSYVNVIALYVPPANSGQKITAVGFRTPTGEGRSAVKRRVLWTRIVGGFPPIAHPWE